MSSLFRSVHARLVVVSAVGLQIRAKPVVAAVMYLL
jgi:hypothetical protein